MRVSFPENPAFWLVLSALNGLLAVAMGAFGAHGFDGKPDYLADAFNVGVQYHMWHALALIAVAWASDRFPHVLVCLAGISFTIGIVLFSGTLYVFGTTATLPAAGAAPLGGVSLMIGWLLLATGVWRGRKPPVP